MIKNKRGAQRARVPRLNNSRGPFSNKKGDIAITILVIGVFAISSFAIISFIYSEFTYGNNFVGISVMQKINADIDEYKFYENNGVSLDAIDSEFSFVEEGGIKYLYREKIKKGKLLFSVQYPVRK